MTEITEPTRKFTPGEWVDDDAVIKKVRETRLGIMKIQLEDGLPNDKDGFDQMHKNLQELSKDAHKSKQLQQEAKSSEEQGKLALAIANAISKNMGGDPFQSKSDPIDVSDTIIPQPTHLLGQVVAAPGELFVGDDTSSYAVFSETVGKSLDAARRGETLDEEDTQT